MHIARAATSVAATLSSGVLIPLYVYPSGGPDCSNWGSLLSTIAAHPTVPYYAVINPNSGPGGDGNQPPAEFQQCIPMLRAASDSVVVLGYVRTGRADPSRAAGVISDVNTYAGWSSSYRVDGIFFDEVSGAASDFDAYANYTSLARQMFDFIALNPGTAPTDTDYYDLADIVLSAEDFYNQFSPSQLSLGAATPPSKQAILLTDGPSTPPTALISELITTDKVGAFWVTDDSQANGANPYDTLPTDIEAFVAAIAAAQT